MRADPSIAFPSASGHPAEAPAIIRVEAVSKRFGTATAVDRVSLDIGEGEFVCLLGPSGCGKTTLLRLLAGFERPSGGRILLDGLDLAGVPPHRRPLNTVFQSYALFPHLSVARNVAYGLAGLGLGRTAKAERVTELLQIVRLDGFGSRYPAQISGGQRQRVALARALARGPRVLLLDEPLSALDRRLREQTAEELKSLQHRLGTTFVMVTHDQAEAMAIADRIGVMDKGRLVQVGAPPLVYERPATRFVASFLGDVNLLEGRVVACQDGLCLIQSAGLPQLFVRSGARAGGERVAVAVRPEKLGLAGPAGQGLNRLPGRVVGTTYLGPSAVDRLALPGGATLRVLRRAGPAPAPGSTVTVAFEPEDAVLVEAAQ